MDPNIPDQPHQNETPIAQPIVQQQPPIQQNPIPQQSINQIPSSGGKWKWILLVIILLLIVGAGIYFLLTNKKLSIISQDETAGWKTYQNTTYNYEIKYPPSWNLVNKEEKYIAAGISPEKSSVAIWSFPLEEVGTSSAVAEITVQVRNVNKRSLMSLLDYESGCKIEAQEAAFAKINCDLEDGRFRTINSVFTQDDKAYTVTLIIMGEGLKLDFSTRIDNAYNKMLSTFKFTSN